MKFSTRRDIAAPIDFVFRQAADFEAHMRQFLRRGVEIVRTDSLPGIAEGMSWDAGFRFRGRQRRLSSRLARFEPPEGFCIHTVSGGVESDFEIGLLALSRRHTRLRVGLELRPRTISARLLIQSMKLGKARLSARFARRVADFAEEVEARFSGPFGDGVS